VPLGTADLNQILCHEEERTVGGDNTVSFDGRVFQLERQRGRRSCAALRVTVRRHLDGTYSIWRGTQRLGQYPATATRPRDRRTAVRPMEAARAVDAKSTRPPLVGKLHRSFPQLPQVSV
jgi:hypothetical protein